MAYELPPLPYPKEALEPHIDAQTMEIHHDKHHAAYVTNVNKAIAGKADLEKKSVWKRVGVASGQRRKAGDRLDGQPGQSDHGQSSLWRRGQGGPGPGSVGACLIP